MLASVIIVITFASCGIFKRSEKHTQKTSLEVLDRRGSTLTTKVKKDSLERTIKVDKGVIITETETTKITEKKGGIIKGSVDLEKLKTGLEILIKDSAGFKISMLLDTLTQQLTTKSESPGEKVTENTKSKTTQNKNNKEEKEKSGSSEENKQIATSQEHRQKESVKVEDKKSEPKGSSFIWFAVAIVVGVLLLIWGLKKIK